MSGNSKRENREIPPASRLHRRRERSANITGGNADMNADGKSDGFILPAKPANNDAPDASAELVEERDPTKRNAEQYNLCRTQSRIQRRSRGLSGVRQAARKEQAPEVLSEVDAAAKRLANGASTGIGAHIIHGDSYVLRRGREPGLCDASHLG